MSTSWLLVEVDAPDDWVPYDCGVELTDLVNLIVEDTELEVLDVFLPEPVR